MSNQIKYIGGMAMAKKVDMFEISDRFNDIMMRELGLDIDDNNYVVDLESESYLTIKEKFIKYCDNPYPMLRHNEIEMNLLENPRLTETLALPFLDRYCKRMGWTFHSTSQCSVTDSNKGYFLMSYTVNGETHDISSKTFVNESVRIFNLICKLNKTERLYQLDEFDIEIDRKK